jgi:hypothetical protein
MRKPALTSLVIVIVLIIYMAFPAFIVYPFAKPMGKPTPRWFDETVMIVFIGPVLLIKYSEHYYSWINWQLELLGL